MKTKIKLLVLMILIMGIWGCGDTGGKEDTDDNSSSDDTPAFTYSKADELKIPFDCRGGTVTFEITYTGTCSYSFDIINKNTQNVQENLAAGTGSLGTVAKSVSLPKGDYFMSANTGTCSWTTIKVYGPVVQYASYVLCNNSPDVPSSTTCKDHGGVSGILGCDRISGYFICKDGTISDTKCFCP